MKRSIHSLHVPMPTTDGAGVKIKRLFPTPEIDHIDPFLLLDHFGSDNADDFISGFPMHPHRGMETVTYMLEGRVRHKDSTGRSGAIESGDVQWMSAGRGIMHEEMPEVAQGKLSGMQLWVNLPAKDKMKKPDYQEFSADSILQFSVGHNTVKLISGELLGRTGNVTNVSTEPVYADISMTHDEIELSLPESHNGFIYLFEGSLHIEGETETTQIQSPQLAVLSHGDELKLSTDSSARFILAAARPINEPVVRWGPFVMNTEEEINQTLHELRSNQFPPAD